MAKIGRKKINVNFATLTYLSKENKLQIRHKHKVNQKWLKKSITKNINLKSIQFKR